MATFGGGSLEFLLAIVLGLGGLPSLPLSLPPVPPDPIIERATPDECLLHVSLAGLATPVAASANHAEALLAEAEVQRFIDEMGTVVEKLLARQEAQGSVPLLFRPEMWSLLPTLLTRPAALTVESVSIDGPNPQVAGSLVVNCGADVEQVRRGVKKLIADVRAIEVWLQVSEFERDGQMWWRFEGLPPGAPDVAWGFKDGLFLAAVGPDGLQNLLAKLAEKDRQPPAWKTALARRLPLERRSMLAHLDVSKVLEIAKTMIRDREFAPGIAASGLDGLRAVQAVAGLTKTEMASATILDFEGEPTGFLAPGQGAVTAADLKAIPADATMAQIVKLDLAATLATGLAWMEAVQVGSSAQVTQMLEQVRAVAGVDVVKHVLEPLGDTWTACTLPGEGSLGLPRMAVSVGLDDAKTFTKTLAAVTALMTKGAAQPGMPPLKFRSQKSAGGDGQTFTVRLGDSPLQPAWCVDGDRFVVGVSAEAVESMLTQRGAARSLADVAEVKTLLGERAAALGYQEPKAAVASLTAVYDGLTPLAGKRLAAAGAALPKLPDAGLVAKHLLPAVSVLRRDAEGDIIAEGRSTLPLVPFGGAGLASSPAVASIAVGMTLPGVQAAREAARRTQGMNNLKQMGLAMLNHESVNNALPAAAICDAEGKPLLSWRVAILPYLDEEELYGEFHLDEPWDSEHNKKLLERMPKMYASPGDDAAKPGTTRYVVPTGKGTVFPEPDGETSLAGVSDGCATTLLIVEAEAAKAVPWTKPEDLAVDPKQPHAGLKNARPTGFLAVFIDGHVVTIPADVAADVLNAMFTRDGGEQVELP
jgi:hypothetical protein